MASSVYAIASVPFSSVDEDGEEEESVPRNNYGVRTRRNKVRNLPAERRFVRTGLILVMVLVASAGIFITLGLTIDHSKKSSKQDSTKGVDNSAAAETKHPSLNPTYSPTSYPSSSFEVEWNLFFSDRMGLKRDSAIFKAGAYQWKAKGWMVSNDPMNLDPTDKNDEQRIIQRFALATLFYSMRGHNSTKFDWMDTDECQSDHISCDGNNIVRALEIDNLVTTAGSIPTEIGLLSHLESLVLKNNFGLVGRIPKSIRHLVGLNQLSFSNNSLTGTLPDEIYSLSLIKYLNLADNSFTGRLSRNIGQLTKLEKLILDNNDFTGHLLPLQLKETKVNVLSLSGNRFNSKLVPAMRSLRELQYLYLDKNSFTGHLPTQLGRLTGLKSLSLSQNEFSGTLPTELGALSELQYLNLAANIFEGDLPEISWPRLKLLHVDDNELVGTIPTTFSEMDDLEVLSLASNAITGPIARTLKTFGPQLIELSLSDNQLSGATGESLCHLTNLEILFLDSNAINGTLNPCLENVTKLRKLVLSSNKISGRIPSIIGNLHNLEELGLEDNDLTGEIPHELNASSILSAVWLDCAGFQPEILCDKDFCKCCPDVSCI